MDLSLATSEAKGMPVTNPTTKKPEEKKSTEELVRYTTEVFLHFRERLPSAHANLEIPGMIFAGIYYT
jgi:hypothetical protein